MFGSAGVDPDMATLAFRDSDVESDDEYFMEGEEEEEEEGEPEEKEETDEEKEIKDLVRDIKNG